MSKTNRKEAIKTLKHIVPGDCKAFEAVKTAIEALKQPEIIRCKDCEEGEPCEWDKGKIICCLGVGMPETDTHREDWFCANGKPKKGK